MTGLGIVRACGCILVHKPVSIFIHFRGPLMTKETYIGTYCFAYIESHLSASPV